MTSCAGLLRLMEAAGACDQEVTFVVDDDTAVGLDGLQVEFDDERVVSDAGIALVATLAGRLGVEALAGRLVRLRRDRPGAANAGRKVMALVFAMVLGADSIDDADVLRAGRTRRRLGGWLPAPSTLGTFVRAFTFGPVRQLDKLLAESLTRAWQAGAGPGTGRLVIDVDSFVGEGCGYKKQGAGYGYTRVFGYHPLLATRADTREALHIRLRQGSANTQNGDQALLRRADRARRAGRRHRGQAAAGRLGLLEHEGLRAAGERGLAVLDRRAQHQDGQGGDRGDPRGRLDHDRLPGRRRGADRRDRLRRAALDRPPHPPARPAGRAVPRLAALRLLDQPQRRAHRGRGRAPRPRRRRAGHRRPQRPSAGALPLRALPRQRRLDRARLPGPQPAALDATARPARQHRARCAHAAPSAAGDPRAADLARARLDAAPARPLALARRLHQRPQRDPRAAPRRLTPDSPAHPLRAHPPARQGRAPMRSRQPTTPARKHQTLHRPRPRAQLPSLTPTRPQSRQFSALLTTGMVVPG